MDNSPLVSIIIPVYNGSNYLREAIESALAQTYPRIEILVVNDGSDDGGKTEAIALSYGEKIRYFRKENGGVSSALNLGIREMRGEYFSWLSHDDRYLPQKVASQVEALREYGDEKTVALCAYRQINSRSEPLSKVVTCADLPVRQCMGWETALGSVLKKTFNGCALLIPKRAFEVCGFFQDELRYAQDALMWYRLFLHGYALVYDPFCGVENRIHALQVTQTRRDLFRHDSLILYQLIESDIAASSDRAHPFLYLTAKMNAVQGNDHVVKLCVQKGLAEKKLSRIQVLKLKCWNAYGKIRPFIRKVYYKLKKHVDTQ